MKPRSDGFPARLLVTAFALAWAASVGLAAASSGSLVVSPRVQPAARSAPAVGKVDAPLAQTSGFVGDDTCATCHENEAKGLAGTLHGKAQDRRTPSAKAGQSCETCHGPGQAHVEQGDPTKIKRFAKIGARDVNETCLTCHGKSTHNQFQGGMHDARNLSCTSCHSVHNPKSERAQLKTISVTETCASCHQQEAAKVRRAGHMPLDQGIREGKMECTSCHNPHGSTNVRMLKVGNTINEACTSCHTEKRGPYLWEHAAVTENCASCHDPHGSNNDRMLVAKAPMLCQRCHAAAGHPSTIYDARQVVASSNRVIGRGCVNCHSQIHGSNSPSGNVFLR